MKTDICPDCNRLMVDIAEDTFFCGACDKKFVLKDLNLGSDLLFENAVDHFINAAGYDRPQPEDEDTMGLLEPEEDWKQLRSTYRAALLEQYSGLDASQIVNDQTDERTTNVLFAVLAKYTHIIELKFDKIRESEVRHAMGHVFQDVLEAKLNLDGVMVPIKAYKDDASLPWPERYARLEEHHQKETKWLISEINRLKGEKK